MKSSAANRLKSYIYLYMVVIAGGTLIYVLLEDRYYSSLLEKDSFYKVINQPFKEPSKPIDCDPINRSYVPYTVELDGVRYPTKLQLHMNRSLNFECLNNTIDTKLILFWNDFFSFENFAYGIGKHTPFIEHKCPVSNCELTKDKSRLDQADLVIVHMPNKYKQVPKHRTNPNQRWVFFLFESPMNAGFSRKNLNDVFNLTTTYTLDSDVYSAYHNVLDFYWQLNETFDENYDYSARKQKLAFTLISNCLAPSDRLSYINELKKYVAVDVYGKCGEKKCALRSERDCHEKLSTEYKFYFAFENSFCKDYITEKFFKVVNMDIVPVVMGMGNHSHYIPKSGYIDVRDYESPAKLAEYLAYLDQNKTAYNAYFKWKKHISFKEKSLGSVMHSLCDMCIQLQLERFYGIQRQTHNDLDRYWSKDNCQKSKLSWFQFFYNLRYDLLPARFLF